MSIVGKERVAIVVAALLRLWQCGLSVAGVAGAVTAVAFFWWFVGSGRGRVS